MLVFLTDGLPTVGETDSAAILRDVRKRNPGRTRLFTFGVGDDVNTLLLDGLARDGNGSVEYVRPNEDLELKVSAFYSKVASPVLSDLTLEVTGAHVTEIYPRRLPDLFAGSQLLLLGRYRNGGKGAVARLTGHISGQTRSFTYPLMLPEQERDHDFLPAMWASRKIGTLLEEIRLHGESSELKSAVIRLSKEYGIVTPYTSFLVQEPVGSPPGAPPIRGLQAHQGVLRQQGRAESLPERDLGPRAPSNRAGEGRVDGLDAVDRSYFEAPRLRESGAAAVEASKAVQELKSRSVVSRQGSVQYVEGRAFYRRGEVWVDARSTERMPAIAVRWGSDAYFQIIRRRPDLARVLALGRQVVVVANGNQVLRIDETGKEALTDAEMRALGVP
jgi:Ca-activated chloride channel family protein